ncbi:MAG: ParA family protein [Pseudomonadota bacterium]|nr:ParA family protein [Pseudomonadota bacterium]
MPGRVLLITKLKGGSGATTTCRELAAAAIDAGVRVGLVDLDSQGGLTRWWSRRTKGISEGMPDMDLLEVPADALPAAAAKLRERYGLVIVDSPPSVHEIVRAVASTADLALVPSRPTVDDLDAVGPIVRLLRGVCDVGFLLTQVPGGMRSRDGAEALTRLASLAPVLGRTSFRLDYPRPAATGRTGYEEGGAPRAEIGELWAIVAERLDMARENVRPSSRDDGIAASRTATKGGR